MKREITPPLAAALIGIVVILVLGLVWKAAVGPSVRVDNSLAPRHGRS